MSFQRLLALPFAALLAAAPAFAADPFDPSDEEDRVAIEALALYPEDVRDHILEASSEADLLNDLEGLQERSKDSFRDLLDPYPQDDQQDLFDLSRYPDLVSAIADGGPKSRGDLERIAARYPEDVRGAALRQGTARHRVIVRMDALLDDFDKRFDDLVADLPPRKAQAFRALLGAPEVLSLMTEHGELTVLLGDAYDRDPKGTRERFADLNLQVARRNAEEAKDWKESVDTDPDLRRDYEAASRDYQADTGYSAYAPPSTTVNVVVNPYPFWVGYPWWYPVSYNYYDPWYWWYPRPYWGHCGWNWGPRFYVGFGAGPGWAPWDPTPFFTSWYFSSGYHHGRYPYLSDHYVDYYWGHDDHHDRHGGDVHIENHYYYNKRVVKKFVYESDRVVSRDFMRGSREERVKRFREYGKLAPELEKVQFDARRKELGGKRARTDRMAVPDRVRNPDLERTRKEAGEILRKREKDAPDLAKFSREPRAGEGAAAAGHGEKARKGEGAGGETGRKGETTGPETGRKREAVGPETGRKRDETGDAKRDRDRNALGVEAPKGRKGGERATGGGGGDEGAGAKGREKERVSPTVERPAGDGGKGGGKRGDEGAKAREKERVSPTFDRPAGDGGKGGGGKGGAGAREREATPSLQGGESSGHRERSGGTKSKGDASPGGGSGAASKSRERTVPRYESTPRVERDSSPAPRKQVQQPRYEQPSGGGGGGGGYEVKRSEPQRAPSASSGGQREHQGGGGGGGGKKRNGDKNPDDEDQGGGGGGGGRKH